MKSLLKILPVLLLTLASCSKKQGCTDPNALNYDSSAEKDGACSYTKVIFYAPSDKIGGRADLIEKIEIYFGATPNEELIGTISTFNHAAPVDCLSPEGAFEFELPDANGEYLFITRYYYDDGSNESGDTYKYAASNSKECHTVNLTL